MKKDKILEIELNGNRSLRKLIKEHERLNIFNFKIEISELSEITGQTRKEIIRTMEMLNSEKYRDEQTEDMVNIKSYAIKSDILHIAIGRS